MYLKPLGDNLGLCFYDRLTQTPGLMVFLFVNATSFGLCFLLMALVCTPGL